MNKAIAGYHILMILSMVDDSFSPREDKLIAEYLDENFPFKIDLDREIITLSELEKDNYMIHFQNSMADFYEDSTPEERNHLIDMAVQLVKADHTITPYENLFLDELFNEWTETSI